MFTCEQRPGSAEAGRDLVDDQVHVMGSTELRDAREKAGRMHEHSRGSLDQRLDHERGDLARTRLKYLLDERERSSTTIGHERARDRETPHQERTEDAMKQLDTTDTDGAEGIAVIGVSETQEPLLRRLSSKLPVLEGLLQRDLD